DTLPESSDIKWMEKHVKKLKLDGAKMEELAIIRENKNHKYLKCWGMIVEYKIDNFQGKGTARVKLEFSRGKSKNEFMIIIDKCTVSNKPFTEKAIKSIVQKELDSIKHECYKDAKRHKNS
ncbi:MAG: hypothetical protein OIF32_12300, partial [Campylobacterales bacterium]|nr:hypothetical protein [Campylobacterales bacterium]